MYDEICKLHTVPIVKKKKKSPYILRNIGNLEINRVGRVGRVGRGLD